MFLNKRTDHKEDPVTDDPKEDFITEDIKKNAFVDGTNEDLIIEYPKYGSITDDWKEDSMIDKKQQQGSHNFPLRKSNFKKNKSKKKQLLRSSTCVETEFMVTKSTW